MTVVLDGTRLTCEQVHLAAHGSGVLLGSTDRAETSWQTARALSGPRYGQTTGVGANKDVTVEATGLDLLRSHAGGGGPLVGEARARATLVVRLNQLLIGGSGLNPGLLPVLASAVNRGSLPRSAPTAPSAPVTSPRWPPPPSAYSASIPGTRPPDRETASRPGSL